MVHLTEPSDPTILLIGRILTREEGGDANVIRILVGRDSVVEAPIELTDFLNFMRTPRLESEVLTWIMQAEGTVQDLEEMISSGRLRRVSGKKTPELLTSLKGLRLVPLGFKVNVPGASGDVVYVGPEEGSTQVRPVSALLAAAMWDSKDNEDLSATFARLSRVGDPPPLPYSMLNEVKALLGLNLAWLEQVDIQPSGLRQRLFGNRA